MSRNQAGYNEKIAKIISLSSNYQRHYDNLNHIKAAVDFNDHKHMKKVLQLSTEKDRYTQNVRKFKLTELQKENEAIVKRIQGAGSPIKKDFTPRSPKQGQKTLEHNSSNKSFLSAISEKTCGSNFRRRTIRLKEIERENKKIADRIMHPKMAKEMNFGKIDRFYQQQQSYSRIRSRFSERSTHIMQSLALGGLKLQRKNVQFLPQLSFKRLDHAINKTLSIDRSARKPLRKTQKNKTILNPSVK